RRYESLREALAELLGRRRGADGDGAWGGPRAAAIARAYVAALAIDGAAWSSARKHGRIQGDVDHIVWSLAHVHALRLGIDPLGEGGPRRVAHQVGCGGLRA